MGIEIIDPNEMNLVAAIRAFEEKIDEIDRKHLEQRRRYNEILDELRKLNTACEVCEGKGKYLRKRSCAEDDRPDPNNPSDWITCRSCRGTGVSKRLCSD